MNRAIKVRVPLAAVAFLVAHTVVVRAQQAVVVTGSVASGRVPLAGAHVRIDAVTPKIDRTTGSDGRYSFVIPSSNVRGQAVRITATMQDRRVRYIAKSATITLNGGALTQDFDLERASGSEPIAAPTDSARGSTNPRVEREPPGPPDSASRSSGERRAITATSENAPFEDLSGTVDLGSVLAGRFAGLRVSTASPGGSAQLTLRGARSILGSNQPLFVVDGVQLDNTVFASAAQRFGLGGFDYGSALADVDLASIASINLLSPGQAAAQYGGRGANGVVIVTTKTGSGALPFAISATQQVTRESYLRLPVFQNQFGQGLNGKFQFFDGRGGGINDTIAQNWGPALNGQPVAQASYKEAGRPDVRLWLAQPDNVLDYFANGRTVNSNGAVQGQNELGSFRAFVGNRTTTGITPNDHLSRLDGSLSATVRPIDRLTLAVNGFGAQTKHDNAAGTGFFEANPVFQFTHMGRQVDTDSLRNNLRDADGRQISWSYSGHNNPYFSSLADNNYSHRYHAGGGASATYGLSSWLTATARGGIDSYRDGRLFAISSGWMGGFPFYAGAGNFSKGGSEGDEISVRQGNAALQLDATRSLQGVGRWSVGVGTDLQNTRQQVRSLGVDSIANVPSAGAPDTATLPQRAAWSARSQTSGIFAQSELALTRGITVQASLRNAWSSIVPAQHTSGFYPSLSGSVDLLRAMSTAPSVGGLWSSAVVRGSWWRDANDVSPYSIETMYAGRAPSGSVSPQGSGLLLADPNLAPEVTTGLQIGTDLAVRPLNLGVGFTLYHERTAGVVLPVSNPALGTLMATNAGVISNSGIEGTLSAQLGNADVGLGWVGSANAGRNTSQVDQLTSGVKSVALGPPVLGLEVQARTGQPLGVLMGRRLLRDAASHSLLLRNGLPVADSAAGLVQLGIAQPQWSFGTQHTLRYRWVSASVLFDGRVGGEVFSATNLVGSSTGTLATTAFRPDSGLLLVGIDAATHAANTQHVSTQDYYHALSAIQEPWVYSATYLKLREARIAVQFPGNFPGSPFQTVVLSLVGRNLYLNAKAPNIDPESVFSAYQVPGLEMGQLPATRSVGIQVRLSP